MLTLCYSGKSAPSASAIADEDDDIVIVRSGHGDVNWGRCRAETKLNPDISNVTNKRVMRKLFADNGVPTPRLVSLEEVHELADSGADFCLVGRPDRHSRGRGFWLCKNYRDVVRALEGTRKKAAATHFMEFVEADHEYRIHVFRGKSIRISEKSFFIDDRGHRDYVTVKPTCDEAVLKQIRRAAKKAVKAVGIDFGAVDILTRDRYEIDNGSNQMTTDVYVLEVNAAPGLGGSMPHLYAVTFKKWSEREGI